MATQKLSSQKTVDIFIGGGTSSGKTKAVAKKIARAFRGRSVIISEDNYYFGNKYLEAQARRGVTLNWDHPKAKNLELLHQHIAELKAGKSVEMPIYSFKTGEVTGYKLVKSKPVIIVEGQHILGKIFDDLDGIKVFVDIDTHGRLWRRILRDIERTTMTPAGILAYFVNVVLPMHLGFVEGTKYNADLIVNNGYNPSVEAQRTRFFEAQVKFKADLSDEYLRRIGAEWLGAMKQIDRYCNPPDRRLIHTGESLRIRKGPGYRRLTYKGPGVKSEYRQRPKIEFDIDRESEKKLLEIYGGAMIEIRKLRVLYHLDGVVFSIDTVQKIENGKKTKLGKFVEIRAVTKGTTRPQLKKVLKKLGLDISQGIKEAYVEM